MFNLNDVTSVGIVLKNSDLKRMFGSDDNRTRVIGTVPGCISSNYSLNGYIDAPQADIYPFNKNPR